MIRLPSIAGSRLSTVSVALSRRFSPPAAAQKNVCLLLSSSSSPPPSSSSATPSEVPLRHGGVPDQAGLPKPGTTPSATEKEQLAKYLNEADKILFQYQDAARMKRDGLLPPRNDHHRKTGGSKMHWAILSNFVIFIGGIYLTMQFIKKMNTDPEFREKYGYLTALPFLPNMKDRWPVNVKAKDREEDDIQYSIEIAERAIRGDFTPEKLEEMRKRIGGVPEVAPEGWGVHQPFLDDDDELDEEDE